MNKSEVLSLIHNVSKSLWWKDYFDVNPKDIKIVEKKHRFIYLQSADLAKAINKLKKFNINLLWDKEYMGLGIKDSICAVSTEPYNSLKRILLNCAD
jgi:hypothetical protein